MRFPHRWPFYQFQVAAPILQTNFLIAKPSPVQSPHHRPCMLTVDLVLPSSPDHLVNYSPSKDSVPSWEVSPG